MFKTAIGWGGLGVGLFFVLSGYLITGILFKGRDDIEAGSKPFSYVVKSFFLRRSLRIFPIYFTVLFLGLIFNVSAIKDSIFYLISYTVNFYFAATGDLVWPIAHLWSLSVEEQFYFFWPFVILLTPKNKLLSVIIAIIILGPFYRHICNIVQTGRLFKTVITFSNMDLLGAGALLAYIRHYDIKKSHKALYFKLCFFIGGFFFFESILLQMLNLTNSFANLNQVFEAFFFCFLVNGCADGFNGLIGNILDFKPLLFLGKISYGIYLYHLFIFSILLSNISKLPSIFANNLFQLFFCTLSAIVIATLSWYLIEKPISKLKNRFNFSFPAIMPQSVSDAGQ